MIKQGRRVGNTTRIVDNAIQDLFNTGTCICRDNIDVKEAHYEVYKKIDTRLKTEHYSTWRTTITDHKTWTISLSKDD